VGAKIALTSSAGFSQLTRDKRYPLVYFCCSCWINYQSINQMFAYLVLWCYGWVLF